MNVTFDQLLNGMIYSFGKQKHYLKQMKKLTLTKAQKLQLSHYVSNYNGRKFKYGFNPHAITINTVKETFRLFKSSEYFDEAQLYGLKLLSWLKNPNISCDFSNDLRQKWTDVIESSLDSCFVGFLEKSNTTEIWYHLLKNYYFETSYVLKRSIIFFIQDGHAQNLPKVVKDYWLGR